MATDDDHLRFGTHRAQLAQQIEPFDVGQHEVHQDDVGLRRGHFLARALRRSGGFYYVTFRLEQQPQKFGAIGMVFDNQNSGRHRHILVKHSIRSSTTVEPYR
jgi:hypothetical protein